MRYLSEWGSDPLMWGLPELASLALYEPSNPEAGIEVASRVP